MNLHRYIYIRNVKLWQVVLDSTLSKNEEARGQWHIWYVVFQRWQPLGDLITPMAFARSAHKKVMGTVWFTDVRKVFVEFDCFSEGRTLRPKFSYILAPQYDTLMLKIYVTLYRRSPDNPMMLQIDLLPTAQRDVVMEKKNACTII